jgi:hypothetical protein
MLFKLCCVPPTFPLNVSSQSAHHTSCREWDSLYCGAPCVLFIPILPNVTAYVLARTSDFEVGVALQEELHPVSQNTEYRSVIRV